MLSRSSRTTTTSLPTLPWGSYRSCLRFLLRVALFSAVLVSADLFDVLDLNQDGLLDKTEYQQGLNKLQAFLQQPGGSSSSGSIFSWFSLADSNNGSTSSSRDLFSKLVNLDFSMAGFGKALTSSFAMILATEIGDKTWFIAAVLSMKHDRWAVFLGAMFSLIVMTILSTGLGVMVPKLLPRQYLHWLSGVLFLYFGAKLWYESRTMEAGRPSEELEEVEEELLQQSNKKADEEEGGATAVRMSAAPTHNKNWWQVAGQSLTLTFLAEWGDRSQIATIALGASKNPWGVALGGFMGHALCTGLAVVGGRMLAAKISEKTVSQVGGATFVVFGIHSLFFETS